MTPFDASGTFSLRLSRAYMPPCPGTFDLKLRIKARADTADICPKPAGGGCTVEEEQVRRVAGERHAAGRAYQWKRGEIRE